MFEDKILPEEIEYVEIVTNRTNFFNGIIDSTIRIKFKPTKYYKNIICEMHSDSRKWILNNE